MTDFKDLIVWQRSRELTTCVYEVTGTYPATELNGLVSQLRRACVSIGANIAEGSARHSRRDQTRFYRTALASAREVESLLMTSADVGYITQARHTAITRTLNEIQRMLAGLVRYTKREGWGTKARVGS